MIFDRRPIPPGAPPEMHDLVRMLAAVAGPAESGDLAGETAALAAFSRLVPPAGISPAAARPARRWLSRRPARARLPVAAALITTAAGLASITAAYVGVLPGPIQQMAHVTVGAPAPARIIRTSRLPDAKRGQARPLTAAAPLPSQPTQWSLLRSQTAQAARSRVPGGPGAAPGPSAPPALPGPSPPTRRPGRARSRPPAPGAPSWTPRSPGAANCLDIATQNAVPNPSCPPETSSSAS